MPKKSDKKHQHDIVFPSEHIKSKHVKSHDDDHHHYRDYRERVLPYHEPIYTYSYRSWMSRFHSTIQDISMNYPMYPTTLDIERMQNFILALPDIVPCHTSLCKSYIVNFVDRNKDNLNAITGNRNYLHEFLRDFFVDIKQKFGQELYEDFDYHGI